MKRRVQEAHRDGEAVHGAEDLLEVLLLEVEEALQGQGLLLGGLRQDEAAHPREAVLPEEHVLRAA